VEVEIGDHWLWTYAFEGVDTEDDMHAQVLDKREGVDDDDDDLLLFIRPSGEDGDPERLGIEKLIEHLGCYEQGAVLSVGKRRTCDGFREFVQTALERLSVGGADRLLRDRAVVNGILNRVRLPSRFETLR
jgi:hypothetical protein